MGQRVVLRRLVPGETGPTGGPAFTDLLGELLAWDDREAVLRTADGTVHRVDVGLVVSGKPVPPRPSPRMRVSAEQLQHAAARSFPAGVREPLGSWLLRDDVDVDPYTRDGRRVARRTSALAVGDPGLPLGEAVDVVRRWYAARARRPWASVVDGSDAAAAFADAGWAPARAEAPTETWVGSVPQVLRRLETYARDDVVLTAADDPNDADLRVHEAVVPSPDGPAHPAWARGRCAVDPADPDTVGILGLASSTHARRRGLARGVIHALLGAAAETGARTVWLHVLADSDPATSLYASMGLAPHHRTRYLAAPEDGTMAAR